MNTAIEGSDVRLLRVSKSNSRSIMGTSKWPIGSDYYDQLVSRSPDHSKAFRKCFDFGTIEVPIGFDKETYFDQFRKKHVKMFSHLSIRISDEELLNQTIGLREGDRLVVQGYQQTDRNVSIQVRTEFLQSLLASTVGAQGLVLLWEQRHEILPKGMQFFSFGEHERYRHSTDDHSVPALGTKGSREISLSKYQFYFKVFEPLEKDNVFLVFRRSSSIK